MGLELELGIGIGDWGMRLEIWDWGLGLEIWAWGLGLGAWDPALPRPTQTCPTLPYPSTYSTLPYPTLPYPLPYPTLQPTPPHPTRSDETNPYTCTCTCTYTYNSYRTVARSEEDEQVRFSVYSISDETNPYKKRDLIASRIISLKVATGWGRYGRVG